MRPRLTRSLTVVLIALIATTLPTFLVASVDAEETPEQRTITLQPGDNFIGWVDEPLTLDDLYAEIPEIELVHRWDARTQRYMYAIPGVETSPAPITVLAKENSAVINIGEEPLTVDELFRRVPGIELVYRWDATTQRWPFAIRHISAQLSSLDVLEPGTSATVRTGAESVSIAALFEAAPQIASVSRRKSDADTYAYAFPGLHPSAGDLTTLQPGMGVVIRLGGDEPVEWTRPIVPAAGLVELRTGVNWTGWLGPDEWSITDVARGIGGFLSEIRLGDHVYDPVRPESAHDWPTVSRGDALIVTVGRGINWLQPTYVLPELIFAGNVNQRIRNDVKRDLVDMAAYNAEEFGVQADPFRLVIIIPGDVRSLFNELEQLGHPREWEELLNWWRSGSGGYGGPDVNVNRAEQWNRSLGRYARARYVLLEEYFHAIQFQLADGAADWPPTWMVEGSINWIRADVETQDRTGYPLSRRLIDARNQASQGPPLEDIEEGNQTWQYSFGLVAAGLLVERQGVASMLDFFRAFAPGRTGPNGQWESQLSWEDAFAATYGISVAEFYTEFDEHMRKWRGNAPRRKQEHQVVMRGTVVDPDGSPRPGIRLTSYEIKNEAIATFGSAQAKSDENGEFALFVRQRADHRILVRLSDDHRCSYWWSSESDNEPSKLEDGELIAVGSDDPAALTIRVDADKCRWGISGVLTGPDDEPLAGIEVQARRSDDRIGARTEIDGSFELVTLAPGSHQLSVNLSGCRLYLGADGLTTNSDKAVDIAVTDQDVTNVPLQVLEDPCRRISGRLLDSTGNGIGNTTVYANSDESAITARTDSNGNFAIAASESGSYRVYTYVDGCLVYYREHEVTGRFRERTLINMSDSDVNGIVMQLPEGLCTLRISGTLHNADGTPRTGVYVRGISDSGRGGDWPAADGTFSFSVPVSGSYKLRVTIDDCQIFYSGDGEFGDESQARSLNLTRSDITDIEFRLPEDPASVCD